jgi:hypothetical protein
LIIVPAGKAGLEKRAQVRREPEAIPRLGGLDLGICQASGELDAVVARRKGASAKADHERATTIKV